MKNSQETHSIWQEIDPPFLPSLSTHVAVDVCVVGGGIAGLTTAYRLLAEGKSVALVERNGFQSAETLRTSGHLCTVLDERYFTLAENFGDAGARLAYESHATAIDDIEHYALQESIDCDFMRVPGFLFLSPTDGPELLERELAACGQASIPGVEIFSQGRSPLMPLGPNLRFPRQARFHAGRYLAGLTRAIQHNGGHVYANTEVTDMDTGRPVRVSTNRGFQIVCEAVVLATNVPLGGRGLSPKMAPYRSYVAGIALEQDRLDLSLFWDTAQPYHYLRTVSGEHGRQYLLVGGADHRTGQGPLGDPFARLTAWAQDRLGITGELRYRWSGQVLEPHDGLAYIGQSEDNVYVITGHSGNGLTYGTLAARIIADQISGRENPWSQLYSPHRLNIHSIRKFMGESARTAAPYSDWITGGDVANLEDIPAGEGAIVREGVQKLAVYRDERGAPHFFSAVCPHLCGIVRWNSTERTWDCPCHGSRFDRLGHVLNGPATVGLRVIAQPLGEGEAASA